MAKLRDILSSEASQVLCESLKGICESNKIRGSVHNVSIPYKICNPLGILSCCLDSKCESLDCSKCSLGTVFSCEDCVRDITSKYNYCKGHASSKDIKSVCKLSIKKNAAGINKSIPINTIHKMKVRPFLMLSTNLDILRGYVYGVPIYSLKERHLNDSKFMQLIENQDIPTMYYIKDSYQGVTKPSYIDLSFIIPIPKEMLLEYQGFLHPVDMIKISERLSLLLDINQYNEIEDIVTLKQIKSQLESEAKKVAKRIELLSPKEAK